MSKNNMNDEHSVHAITCLAFTTSEQMIPQTAAE